MEFDIWVDPFGDAAGCFPGGAGSAAAEHAAKLNVGMDELAEMETFRADVGDEGKILQEDLKQYFENGIGDKEDLIFRLELYFYAFKLFCRRTVTLNQNQFTIFLNDSLLDWNLIKLVMDDLTDFELEIEAVKENRDVLINLNFTYHF